MRGFTFLSPLFVFALLAIQSCTQQEIYTAIQQNRQIDCQRKQQPLYEECMEQSSEPYEDYRRAREELLEE